MAVSVVISKVEDIGNDQIRVTATINGLPPGIETPAGNVDGGGSLAVTVTGWKSHLTNWYPPSAYNPDGSLKPASTPINLLQAGTPGQRLAACKQLVQNQYGQAIAAALTPADLGISG